MVRDPRGKVGLSGLHVAELDGVAAEQVRDDGQVTVGGELVGEELGVDIDAEDVAQDDDGLLGGLVVLGVGDVGVDCDFTARSATHYRQEADECVVKNSPPPTFLISPTGVPSCLKPEAQQAPGALEAILNSW